MLSFSFNDIVIGRHDTKMCNVLLYIYMYIYIYIYINSHKSDIHLYAYTYINVDMFAYLEN